MFRMTTAIAAAVIAISSVGASAATLTVPAQFTTIQGAINAAIDNDLILVSPGTYAESITFAGKNIRVQSTGGAAVTIIDGTGQNNSVVRFVNGEGINSVLDGFTVRNGVGKPGASRLGGGILIENSTPRIENCIIMHNTATFGAGVYANAAFTNSRFTNCVIARNTASNQGGGVYHVFSSIVYRNCTIVLNVANGTGPGNKGGAWYNGSSSVGRFANGIMWGNTPDQFGGGGPVVVYSLVEGGTPGTGNISGNPLFVSVPGNNFRLQPGSPCIDAGDSTEVATTVTKDLDGNPRGVNDPAVPDTGVAVFGLVVDMGAYERQVAAAPSNCPADLTGDGVVDSADLLQLLSSWGMCPPALNGPGGR